LNLPAKEVSWSNGPSKKAWTVLRNIGGKKNQYSLDGEPTHIVRKNLGSPDGDS
jgi:hypothetical protein